MITITSGTQSPEEITEALTLAGVKPAEAPADNKAPEAKPKADDKTKSEQADAPGGNSADAKAGESGSASEADADVRDPKAPPAEGEEHKPKRGDFKSKLVRAQEHVIRLQDELEAERGSKTKLREELEAAQERLTSLQGTETKAPADKPKADEDPVRPKRPKLDDDGIDFDQEKFEQATDAYELQMESYYKTVARLEAKRDREAKEAEDRASADRKAAVEANDRFVERLNAGKARFQDYDEVVAALGPDEIDIPDATKAFIFGESEDPAALIYHFMTDALDNGGKELARITALNPIAQVRALARLEDSLSKKTAEDKPAAEKESKPVVTEQARPPRQAPEGTARPKPVAKEPVEEPIIPVGGGRTAGAQDTLEAAVSRGDWATYRRLRAEQIARRQTTGVAR